MRQWTEDQKKAIASGSRRLYCSAAAGSGKTAVMIERIVRLIREGADPFSFLVITFTNAAAAEMKEKIRVRLLEEKDDPRIAAAAEKAGAMEVCTIHAFCQHLIRQEFQVVGVDPLFQICTGAQREKLFSEAFRDACGNLREQEDPDYRSFTERYSPEKAQQIVSETWQFIMSLPDPFGWLAEKTESVPLSFDRDHPWFRTVQRMMREKVLSLRVILRRQADLFDEYEKSEACRPVFIADSEKVEAYRKWMDGEPVSREQLQQPFARMPVLKGLNDREIDWKERYAALRKKLKDQCGELDRWIFGDRDQMFREFEEVRNSLRGLRKITEETNRLFELRKARANVLEFSDLEHKALAILRDEAACAAVRGRYQRVFVDECQDVSSVQDALIQALAGGENSTLFMVGDVKQSIYRFRLANPKLFLSRITGAADAEAETVFLQENFRSRPEVLETANTIFRDVMRAETAGVDYTPADELRPGRKDCGGAEPVRVDLLETGEETDRLTVIADHVAEEIRQMRMAETERKYEYRDMVILMPEVSTDGPKLTELLRRREIPVFFDGRGSFFEQPEIEMFRNLLYLLDNPHLDLPLLTVLVNPPFCFTEEELSLIRLRAPEKDVPFWQAFETAAAGEDALARKCREVSGRLASWRFLASRVPPSDLCWYLLEDSAVYALCGALDHGRAAQKNLRSFCLQADRAAERGIGTLRKFLDFLSEQAAGGELQAAASLGSEDQVVRVMTMHKSKGLQFPVVFCLGLEKGLKGRPGGELLTDDTLGLCLRYKVPDLRLSRKSAADEIFEWKKQHDVKAEKICLLYVAMTRAQERLYLVGTETDRPLWHMPPGGHRTADASDYLDCVLPALMDEEKKSTTGSQPSKPWKITVFENNQQKTVEKQKVIHNLEPWVKTLLSAPPVDDLWKIDPDRKPSAAAENVLKKYSVTAVLQNARNRIFLEEEEQTPEEKRTPDYVTRAMRLYDAPARPSFLTREKETTGAARGTAVHRFLSLVDLDRIREAGADRLRVLNEQTEQLRENGVLTAREASWIRPEKILRFFDSPVGERMLSSPEVHREWDFNLYVRERGMIVQGMIDCAFREGDGWILLDYKTDRIEDEQAFMEEYRPQLAWYAEALRRLTGLPVRERWLYALSVDKGMRLE